MKKLNVGIVGLGRIHGDHVSGMKMYPELFNLAACADCDPSRLAEAHEGLKDAAKYGSLEEMLNHPELDMVTICTRHPDHVPMALKVLEAGKIAVVEKPVATGVAEMDVLLETAKKYPHKLFFRHNRRFEPAFIKTMELINSGLIGAVQYIKLYRSVGYCRRNDWMTMTEFYGGLLSNWGPHLIDQALQFLGSPVTDIWADVRRVISIGDGDDLFKILLKGENGRVADIEVTGANAMPGREMEIIGNRGTIIFENGKLSARILDPSVELKEQKPHPETPPKKYGNFDETLYFVTSEYQLPEVSMAVIWKHIYEEAVNGVPSPVTAAQAGEVVRVTEEAFKRSGFAPIRNFRSKVK